MTRHWKGILTLFAMIVLGFGGAVVTDSMFVGMVTLLIGLVLAFIMATAWMRPAGSPREHHAAGDRFVNDTRP